MNLFELAARLDRAQRSLRFKIVASAVVALIAVGAFVALVVAANAPGAGQSMVDRAAARARDAQRGVLIDRGPLSAGRFVIDSLLLTIRPIEGLTEEPPREQVSSGAAPDAQTQASERDAPRSAAGGALRVAMVFAAVTAGMLSAIWLGLGLSLLGLLAAGLGAGWPLMSLPATAGLGQLLLAAAPLLAAFLVGMELVKATLGFPIPLFAVARNVLSEAVRMKVSLVFIVLLILLLSATPGALNEDQPLRYRVQQWLQYGMGLSYAVLALLTLFFAAGTVAFEQRDKVIWQTMTKPVAPWQYLLGKWTGVMALNAVLLTVTASGVYLFTEYLRFRPAQGELAYHVRADGVPTLGRPDLASEDRRLLESQVLVARQGKLMSPLLGEDVLEREIAARVMQLTQEDSSVTDSSATRERIRQEITERRAEQLRTAVESRVLEKISRDPSLSDSPRLRYEAERELEIEQESLYRTIPPGGAKAYLFTGLADARSPGANPRVTLRYRVNAGSNDPTAIYRVRFYINQVLFERQVALAASQTLLFDKRLIDEDGTVTLVVENDRENPRELAFPPDGLEVLYSSGDYATNFVRIMFVMWVKLGFTAAVAIAASTFLSFPVACLVAMTVLFAAESAGYLKESLDYYVSMTKDGIDYVALVVRVIAVPISRVFQVYAELKPTAKLVDGRLLGWGPLLSSSLVLIAWAAAVLGLGWAIFRQRELATYSGR